MSCGSSGNMAMQPDTWKPPIQTGQAGREERAGEIDRPRKLVGLHADQAD